MGRKKQDPTFIKSIRVNEDIKEFLENLENANLFDIHFYTLLIIWEYAFSKQVYALRLNKFKKKESFALYLIGSKKHHF